MNYTIEHRLKKSFIHILLLLFLLFILSAFSAMPAYASAMSIKDSKNSRSDVDKPKDTDISSFIRMELIVQDGVDWNDINVKTEKGIVTLSGTSRNMLEKERSVQIAKSIKGVRAVIDRIRVVAPDVSDDQLKRDVESALLLDPATESDEIDVEAREGKVTLSGKVDSWQERRLAEKVVKSVRGVKEMENNIYFKLVKNRPDSEIEKDIVRTLHWDIRVEDGLVHVEVENGKVRLSGAVGSASEKSQAVADSWVAGVLEVDDSDLIISPWADDEIMRRDKYAATSDEAIKKAVEDAFLYDPRVISFNPEVTVKDGKVTLSGVVNNLKAKRAAEIDARNVVGVWNVENLLQVRGTLDLETDKNILHDVRQVLSLNPYLDQYDVAVSVNNGTVTLDGYVENFMEKYKAEDFASAICGVRKVKNNIEVAFDALPYAYDYNDWFYLPYSGSQLKPHPSVRNDWEIENNIEAQLWWSPFVDLSNITIEVDNGIAILEGEVDSWREYYLAEKNAYEGGAREVDNDLEVSN